MGLFKNTTTDSEKKGLQVQVNHKLIDEKQADVFTHMVKEAVRIIVIGALVTTAAAFTLKFGSEYLADKLIQP